VAVHADLTRWDDAQRARCPVVARRPVGPSRLPSNACVPFTPSTRRLAFDPFLNRRASGRCRIAGRRCPHRESTNRAQVDRPCGHSAFTHRRAASNWVTNSKLPARAHCDRVAARPSPHDVSIFLSQTRGALPDHPDVIGQHKRDFLDIWGTFHFCAVGVPHTPCRGAAGVVSPPPAAQYPPAGRESSDSHRPHANVAQPAQNTCFSRMTCRAQWPCVNLGQNDKPESTNVR
jgi:hypothetical protein